MQTLERFAELSVARGCGFAAVGIGTIMLAFAEQIPMALYAGGLLTLGTSLILILKAQWASRRPYKRTELWIMLHPVERPDAAVAQQIIGTILRETYQRFAFYTAGMSILMLSVSFVMRH
jgi:hypothetical protein